MSKPTQERPLPPGLIVISNEPPPQEAIIRVSGEVLSVVDKKYLPVMVKAVMDVFENQPEAEGVSPEKVLGLCAELIAFLPPKSRPKLSKILVPALVDIYKNQTQGE